LDAERVLAFRLARSGLAERAAGGEELAAAVACPASDFSRDAGPSLRRRRPRASPGAVFQDGRLVALWRAKAKGKATTMLDVEPLAKTPKLRRGDLDDEAQRIAALRGTPQLSLVIA
jgi:hypothetical protein